MRILILSQFYPPEPCAASNRVAALAGRLAFDGHAVTVVTAMPSFPSGTIDERYRGLRGIVENDRGVEIVRVWTYASRRLRRGARALNWLSVALGATVHVIGARRRYDAVVVTSPPITLGLPALLAKARHRAPLVFDVRDMWPELGITSGVWKKDSLVARAIGWFADVLYRASSLVCPVTKTAEDQMLARGVPASKIRLTPNGYDDVVAAPEPPFIRRDGDVIVTYVGNLGIANGLDVVLNAARLVRTDSRFRFILVGDGLEAGRLRRRLAHEHLDNVSMLGVLPRDIATATIKYADVCVVPLRPDITDSLPTKLFDALYVGTPVVVSAAGEARRLIEESGGGIAVPPGDAGALVGALRALASDPALRERCRERGGAFVREHYDRARVMAGLSADIDALPTAAPRRDSSAQHQNRFAKVDEVAPAVDHEPIGSG